MNVYHILDQLNDKQQEAVTSNDQNILVLSEAGSRKTRVLVNRILLVTISEKIYPMANNSDYFCE
ncbi:UvrD-helicase domain-containing protein [Candidatus Blochmanniella pennsylvanica]|uniref:UvrD-helicase domain-containing protein n=1 Tax=Candidatus Blochmanniella pennsylvanica TaxID=101534 RepID=UPI0002D3065A|nr:UvrD-helicase domain-containing protein [Candidatus Blochmannia pennsylvanicus]UOY04393.1 UvrD-helicase domain-containing protein [Candidatus Blochmannia pennsylvanicus]